MEFSVAKQLFGDHSELTSVSGKLAELGEQQRLTQKENCTRVREKRNVELNQPLDRYYGSTVPLV